MSEEEPFLARWSRRKRAVGDTEPQSHAGDDAPEQTCEPAVPASKAEPEFDPATLPPLDSIAAGTDIREFLQKGVPAELTRAALRRAWAADPAIRDFVGLAENAWDFNAPDGVPGFGPLPPADDVRRLMAQALGEDHPAQSQSGAGSTDDDCS